MWNFLCTQLSDRSVPSTPPTHEALNNEPIDPELEALPAPRRPWRFTTLTVLMVTPLAALATLFALRADLGYALRHGAPLELGSMTDVQLSRQHENTWAQLRGQVTTPQVAYRRPLDSDSFRVAPLEGHGRHLWVALRLPAELDAAHYVPPSSFVGRLVPLHDAGMRQAAVLTAIQRATGGTPPEDAWLLVDGEAPVTSRWLLGVAVMLLGFMVFCGWGLLRLTHRTSAPG